MNFELYNSLLPKTTSSTINMDIYGLLNKLNNLYAATGSEQFKQQMDNIKDFIRDLPDDKCVAWGINKQSFNIQPTPIPSVPLYGLLQREPLPTTEQKQQECDELFNPKYTLKVFTNLQQAKNAESASVVTSIKTYEKMALFQQELYHPKLYKIVCEPIEDASS